MRTIDDILLEINEDKIQNNATTSNKFKKDVWDYFQGFNDKVAVEFGTHKGQTTKVMSYLFKTVYTINNNDNLPAKELNKDIDNITYINFNLYSGRPLPINDTIDVFLIDAGHMYEDVISDFHLATSSVCAEDCYIIFDDYGCNVHEHGVRKAVDDLVKAGAISIVKEVGHETGYDFGRNKILDLSEGLITKVIWH
jgi:hypothetical protein